METGAPPETKEVREYRRYCAVTLSQQGLSQTDIAKALGVTQGAVSQWLKRTRDGGLAALQRTVATGAPPKLCPTDKAKLPELLSEGAEEYGFRGNVWTHARIASVIEQVFGVRYHPSSLTRLLRSIGWSRKKPRKRATQRNEAAIRSFRDQTYPDLKKSV